MIFSDLSEQWGHFLAQNLPVYTRRCRRVLQARLLRSARGGSDILKKDAEELCREMLGKLLNISDYHRIFFTSGATESMNTLLCGLDFGEEGQGCSRNTGRA